MHEWSGNDKLHCNRWTDHKQTILKMMRNLGVHLLSFFGIRHISNSKWTISRKNKKKKEFTTWERRCPRNRSILKKMNWYKTATPFMDCKQENKNYAYLPNQKKKKKGHFHTTKATVSKNLKHYELKLESPHFPFHPNRMIQNC